MAYKYRYHWRLCRRRHMLAICIPWWR